MVNLGWVGTNPFVLDGLNGILYVHQLRIVHGVQGVQDWPCLYHCYWSLAMSRVPTYQLQALPIHPR